MPESLNVALLTEPGGPHLSIYIDLLGRNPSVKEVSVADSGGAIFTECRQRWQGRFGDVATYRDYADLLREKRPDLVVACFAADHAPAPIEAALRAGSHVLAEKPACVRAVDFERLHQLARQANRHLMLAFATRSNPLVMKARELVSQGALGKLYGATAWFVADQARLRKPAYHSSWVASKRHAGGGHLIWLGIHYVDLLQFISGQRIGRVCGFTANVGGDGVRRRYAGYASIRLLPRPQLPQPNPHLGSWRMVARRPGLRRSARMAFELRAAGASTCASRSSRGSVCVFH
jgi:predicted dehydrogenase